MSREELFKPEIIEKLNKWGLQVNMNHNAIATENQFFQIVNSPATINAIKIYINANLSRAATALNMAKSGLEGFNLAVPALGPAVYTLMKHQLFLLLASNGDIQVKAALFEQEPTQDLCGY